MEEIYWLQSDDNIHIHLKKWHNQEQPRAILQIAHGMAEHIERYAPFARFLTAQNIYVYGHDHRGHGKTGEAQGVFGFFSEVDGFQKAAEDLYRVTKQIKQEYPATPLFLFGHSMGSFLTRKYIQTHSHEIDGVILSGTGHFDVLSTGLGKLIASTLPAKKESKLMNTLAFGNYNRKIHPRQTNFDWLSSDPEAVRKYVEDPYAGFVPTARFFYDLMTGLRDIHRPKKNDMIRKDLPMLLISGDADPVGSYGKGVWKTARLFEQIGIRHIITMLLENGRHELLNESNKAEVYEAIYRWLTHITEDISQ